MSDDEFWNIPSIATPKLFYSEKTGQAFTECSMCGNKFTEYDTYIIEKAFKKELSGKHEMIFEYALCQNCMDNMRTELSDESLKNIEMYYKLYVDFEKRNEKLLSKSHFDLTDWISNCIITGNSIDQEEEFTVGGMIINNRLILNGMPFALGQKAMYEMQEVLSKKTKDFLDGFQKEIFPPDVREKIPDGSLIIL